MEDNPKKASKTQKKTLLRRITENLENPKNSSTFENLENPETPKIPKFYKNEIFGTNSYKRKNFLFITKNILIYISGLSFKILNLKTKTEKIFHSISGGGIGCIEIHPSKKYFAIGEKFQNFENISKEKKNQNSIENKKTKKTQTPKILIYSYPTLKLQKTLPNGTEKSFNCLTFSKSGKKLASIGNSPDFNLIIWDWVKEIPILKVKAFSQEIYDIRFSSYDENFLVSCGMAHIKFWKIAETFTGLKLKGEIGKFGQIELSDISAVVVLEDGKVVSGSENGDLLLWEGNFIKAVLKMKNQKNQKNSKNENFEKNEENENFENSQNLEENCDDLIYNCHEGNIESLRILYDSYLISAGKDDFIKIWSVKEIENIIEDNNGFGYITPLQIIKIDKSSDFIQIKNFIKNDFKKKNEKILNSKNENFVKIEEIDDFEMNLDNLNKNDFEEKDNFLENDKNEILDTEHIINIQTQFADESTLFLQNAKGSIISLKFNKNDLKKKIENLQKNPKNPEIPEKTLNLENSENPEKIFKKKIIHEFPAGKIVTASFYEEKVYLGYSEGICLEFDKNEKMTKSRKLDFYGICSLCNYKQNLLIGNKKGVLSIFSKNFKKLDFLKVFDQPLKEILVEDDFVVCVAKNEIFVLSVKIPENVDLELNLGNECFFKGEYLYRIKKSVISSICLKNKKLYIGLQNGKIRKIDIKKIEILKNEKNFEIDRKILNEKKGILKMAEIQKPKQDENDIKFVLNDKIEEIDIEWDSLSIRSILNYKEEIMKISENEKNENFGDLNLKKKSRFSEGKKKKQNLENDFFEDDERVLVSSEGDFIGFLYLLKLSENEKNSKKIIRPIKIIKTRKKIITKMIYTKNSEKIILGYEDGILEIRNSKNIDEIFFVAFGHDKILGSIFYINKNFNKNFFSVANDNSLIFYDIEKKMEKEFFGKEKIFFEEKKKNDINKKNFLKFEEITKGYSLQQEKIQAVEDKKKKNSELYKKNLREKILKIQNKFFLLKKKNENLEKFFQVENSKLIFDKKFHDFLIKKKDNKISEAEKEVEYEKEICKMKVEKIKKFYFSDISCKSFGVSKISSKNFVFSIKLKKITKFMISELEKICEIIEKEKNEETVENSENKKNEKNPNCENLTILKDLKSKFSENKNINYFYQMKNKIKEECRIYSTIDKMRNYKKTITSQIKNLRKKEPSIKNVENSKEILDAKSNFGHFILKSSENYKVSDDNRINVQNLQTQILLMEKFIYNSSKTFNNTLIELKNLKRNLLKKIKITNLRLKSIYKVLNENEGFFEFCFFEKIENFDDFLKIDENELLDFIKELDEKEKIKKRGIYGGMDDDEKSELSILSQKNEKIKKKELPRENRIKNNNSIKYSKILKIEKIKLISEKNLLKKNIKLEIDEFDRNVDWAIEERVKLKYELKMAEMKILELYKDLLEIQIYENQDNSLLTELFEQREILKNWNEKKTTNATKLKKLEKKEQNAKSELDLISEKYREKVFPNEIEKSDFVYKYYKKHYKGNSEKENLMELDNSEDLEMMNSGLENEKKEWVLTVEQNDEWLELLKKKRNAENTIRYFRDDKILLDNECNKIEEKIGICQKNLNKIKNCLDLLQLTKSKKINKLQSSFILSLDQIFSKLPLKNLKNIIMFTEEQFMNLNKRIIELKNQCDFIDKEKLNLIKSQESLIKELGLLRFSKKKSQEELKENFHLKFGKVIDLKILDTLKQTKRLKDLKIKLKEIEKNSLKKIEDFKISLLKTKNDLFDLKKKNTGIIKKITLLGSTQLKLNKTLDSTNKHIFKNEDNSGKENVVNYRKDLLSIIKLLNNELDELKKEILVLKNKGFVM